MTQDNGVPSKLPTRLPTPRTSKSRSRKSVPEVQTPTLRTVVEEAHEEIAHGNAEVEEALENLRDKVGEGARFFSQAKESAKNPLVVLSMILVVGFFFGEILGISFRQRRSLS